MFEEATVKGLVCIQQAACQGWSLRADLQKMTEEEDELSGANQSQQPQALYSRDFLRKGSLAARSQQFLL